MENGFKKKKRYSIGDIKEMLRGGYGVSKRFWRKPAEVHAALAIATKIVVSAETVRRALKDLAKAGTMEVDGNDAGRRYRLAPVSTANPAGRKPAFYGAYTKEALQEVILGFLESKDRPEGHISTEIVEGLKDLDKTAVQPALRIRWASLGPTQKRNAVSAELKNLRRAGRIVVIPGRRPRPANRANVYRAKSAPLRVGGAVATDAATTDLASSPVTFQSNQGAVVEVVPTPPRAAVKGVVPPQVIRLEIVHKVQQDTGEVNAELIQAIKALKDLLEVRSLLEIEGHGESSDE